MLVQKLVHESDWEKFLRVSSDRTFYHSLRWKEVIEKSFPCSAFYLTIKDESEEIVGLCPGFITPMMRMKIYASIPHSDYGGPLILRHSLQGAILSLRDFLDTYRFDKNVLYARLRFMDAKAAHLLKSPLGRLDTGTGVSEIDLLATPSQVIWAKRLSMKTRRNIRIVERDGYQCEQATSRSDLVDFYRLYSGNMKWVGGVPLPYEFMKNVWEMLYPDNLRIWLLGKGKRVAGMAVLKDDLGTYCTYVGIDRKGVPARYSVIRFLTWKEITTAEQEGCRYVSLGGTPSDPSHPNYQQKVALGASFHQHTTVWYPMSPIGSVLFAAIPAWRTIRRLFPIRLRIAMRSRLPRF